jgi:hypothetical protein
MNYLRRHVVRRDRLVSGDAAAGQRQYAQLLPGDLADPQANLDRPTAGSGAYT